MNPNWFETFFEGLALDMWRGAVTPEVTARETDFLERALQLQAGMSVRDVPCGCVRHAVEMARRGVRMTGVDLSVGYIEEERGQSRVVEWVLGDLRELPWRGHFDAAYCWGNSFAYFDHENCERFLAAVATSLKPGGRFVLDSGAVAESILPALQRERKMRVGDIDFYSRNEYVAAESRMDITYTFTRGEQQEVKPIHQWVHSAREMGLMLRGAGLELWDAFGDLEWGAYVVGSPRFIGLAQRGG